MAYAVIIYENQYSVFSLNFYSSHGHFACVFMFFIQSLWSLYGIRQTIIFLPCDYYISVFFFPRLISAVGDWMSTILLRMVWP